MDDLFNPSILFVIFGIVLVLYGALVAKTGDINLLPYRSSRSIPSGDDEQVRRVGRIVVRVGLVIGAIALVLAFVATKSS